MYNFKIDSSEIDKIGDFNKKEKDFRLKNLENFNKNGFPNKRNEDWKFSDLREIVSKNFKKLNFHYTNAAEQKIDLIKEFEHNSIILTNGELTSSNFSYEDKEKIKIQKYINNSLSDKVELNPLINLNHAMANKGFILEVKENYKFNKILVIYNLYTEQLNANIINCKNKIIIGKNSELHTLEYLINNSKYNFFNNIYENIIVDDSAKFKNICIQKKKSSGYFHKYSNNKLGSNASYSSFVFPAGPKFNKLDLEFNLNGKNSECKILAASYLSQKDHQEIKTRINHFAPDCKSFQKVKNVLDLESKGVFQGKIFVKDIAQKTDAYQLSKAILLNDDSEFDSKPELEIYADDVKCSHGSSSGSIDENSVFYLMSRGLSKKESINLLIDGFLSEITDEIKSQTIKTFIINNLRVQLDGYKKH
tara:strand:- start:1348 stop:2607 length:1260 start_codon:yes stop_codon:yes gene_type:complete